MKTEPTPYTVLPYPRTRLLMVDGGRLARNKHIVHGLVEFDVSHARACLRSHKQQTGESLSFTAFILACLGKAIDMNRHMHAYRNWRNRLIIFDEVDVNTLFEVEVEGKPVLRPHILRGVNQKTVHQLHAEIRAFQHTHAQSTEARFIDWFVWLPGFVRRAFLRVLFQQPHWIKAYYGTVLLTSVGMFGNGGGWGIPAPNHTLQVTLGGIAQKPALVAGKLEMHEYLSVTISFDHDIVDGAPAARFVQRLKELIEAGDGLPDSHRQPPE